MKYADYAKWTDRATKWITSYFSTIADQPVRAKTAPGEISAQMPGSPPEQPVNMETILLILNALCPMV